MTPSPRLARLAASWLAAAAVWCSVLAAAVTTGLRSNADTLHPATAAALGSLGAACGGILLWRTAARHLRIRRTPYFILAAGVQVGAGSVAALCWLPGDAGPLVAGAGLAVQSILFAVALLRLPDDEWNPSAVLRRAVDGLFVGACLLFAFWLGPARPWYEGTREHTDAADLAVIVPGILGGLLFGLGLTTTFRLTRWRRRHALAFSAALVVQASSVALVAGLLWGRPMAATLWWSVVWIGGAAALVGATRLALRQKPAIEKPNYPGVHYAVMGSAAVLATAVFLQHGASTGPLPLDAALLALVIACALGGRLLMTFFDVRRATDDASDRQERLDAIVAVASDVVLVLDPELVITWHPEECAWQPATADGRCVGEVFLALVHPDDRETTADALRSLLDGRSASGRVVLDVRMLDVHRRWRHTETVVTDRRGHPQVRGLVARSVDIGRRRSLEAELNRMAYSDPLTGLANRRALLRRLEDSVSEEGGKTALLLIDLDGFKNVNDTRGHDLGDEMLVEVSRRLRSLLRPTDLGARLGGDEFAVLLRATRSEAVAKARAVVEALSEPVEFHDGSSQFTTGSVGVATAADGIDDHEVLLRNADLALRAAKQAGKNRFETYDADFDRKVRRRNELSQELRGAIGRAELSLVLQPVFNVPDNDIVGAEALLRWNHPRLGKVSPGEFIPAASEAGLTQDLAVWAVKAAARQLASWRDAGIKAWISVNVSVKELHTARFATEVNEALIAAGVPASRLVLEVTEHDFSTQMNTLVAQLSALRGAGVRIALDDFGSGYNSLGQLDRLPLDIIKIDRDIVAKDDGLGPLATVAIELGKRLGLEVIAEGVETDEQYAALSDEIDPPLVQGYLLAMPMSAADLDERLGIANASGASV